MTVRKKLVEVKGRVTGPSIIIVNRRSNRGRVALGQPFQREPDFGVTSVNCDFTEL